jgi:epoxyqueuosine reductase
LIRNAVISLGNFRDERAIEALMKVFKNGDDELRGYAAWSLGNIGGSKANNILKTAAKTEQINNVKQEIEKALSSITASA